LTHLPRDGLEACGFGPTVGGCGVPPIARTRLDGQGVAPAPAPARDPRQLSLF
jgi:hypothetical protein